MKIYSPGWKVKRTQKVYWYILFGMVTVLALFAFCVYLSYEEANYQDIAVKPQDALEVADYCTLPYITCSGKKAQETQQVASRKAVVTAYSELDSCHTGESCLMASGKKAYVGAAACPRSIPLGTRVRVGTSIYTCEDRTARWVDGRYDLFMGYGQEAYQSALSFGKQTLTVTLL